MLNISSSRRIHMGLAVMLAGFMMVSSYSFAETPAQIKTSGEGLVNRVAPTEFLPFSVKLINFGQKRRVDVTINYSILNATGKEVYSENETVAVETTASYVKQIQIPRDTPPGNYTAVSTLLYDFQMVPATSRFEFSIEKKFLGFFLSDLILYGGLSVGASMFFYACLYLFLKPVKRRSPIFNYTHKPRNERIYYEILSDTIAQMRFRVGDVALEIASSIPDFKINRETGEVYDIQKDPSKIIALLVLKYETLLGQQIQFQMRRNDAETKRKIAPMKKNITMVRTYFE